MQQGDSWPSAMRLGFVKSSLEGGGDLKDMVEAEACSNLTGMLRQLADLVDHTATVFEGLEAQVRPFCLILQVADARGRNLAPSITLCWVEPSPCLTQMLVTCRQKD